MIKTGIDDIPGLPGLKEAITKKQSETEFLNDLRKAQQVYAQSVYQSHSDQKVTQTNTNVNDQNSRSAQGQAGKVGWDGRVAVKEAKGPNVTIDGVTYKLLGLDKNGSKVYQDVEVLKEQAEQAESKQAEENQNSKQTDDTQHTEVKDEQKTIEKPEDGDIITTKGIGIQFFANKSIQKQSNRELRKSMNSWESRLAEHTEWLSNPKLHDQYWDEKIPQHKAGLLKHWQHEIENFKNNIKEAEEELRKRGNYDD